MRDSQRMYFAVVFSMLLHASIFCAWAAFAPSTRFGVFPGTMATTVLRLQPPAKAESKREPEPPHNLVDVAQPAPEPPREQQNIATANSLAADEALREGMKPAPTVDMASDLDAVARRSSPPAPEAPPPVPPAPPAPLQARTPESAPPKQDTALKLESASSPAERALAVASGDGKSPDKEGKQEASAPPAADAQRVQMADARAEQAAIRQPSRGSVNGEIERKGLASFDAIQDQLAPYLKTIRSKVEQRWNGALLTRYSGTSPTETVIECAISPDGRIVYAEIVSAGRDRVYAALCKDAIEHAGPFGAFPFPVPDIYRTKNLEIRWTFSFL